MAKEAMEVQKSIAKMTMEMERYQIQNILQTQLQMVSFFANVLKSKVMKN
jgi:hypothetical protein